MREGGGDIIARVLFLDEDKACPESLDFPMIESEKKIEIFGEKIEKKKIWQELRKRKEIKKKVWEKILKREKEKTEKKRWRLG